jgi:hypothetical protein
LARARHASVLAAAAIAAIAAFVASAGAGTPSPSADAGRTPGSFLSLCMFSHRSADDPIVYFGRPGVSHDHTFVGNVSTDAFSTAATLRGHGTSCARTQDTAAYWAPTLLLDGAPVEPSEAAIYYTRHTSAKVRAFPTGLMMVAGNSHAGAPQSPNVTYWDCGLIKTTFYGPMLRRADTAAEGAETSRLAVPRCPPATRLQLHVNFPDCWNGKRLDSLDHRSHMAYSVRGSCPRGHPVAVPAISLIYQYPPLPAGAVALSSGGIYSGHADFVNAWNERVLTRLVDRCLNARRSCETGS